MDEAQGDRNFSRDMSQRITEILESSGSSLVPSVAAVGLVFLLQKEDPELLQGWLSAHAPALIAEQIKHRLASARQRARLNASRSAFAADARRFVGGEVEALSHWRAVRYVVDANNTQRPLLEMNSDDLNYAASRYGRIASSSLLEEAFLRALAGKVGKNTVGEIFTEDQIDAMYSSIGRRTNVAAG